MIKNKLFKNGFQYSIAIVIALVLLFNGLSSGNGQANAQIFETPYGGQNLFQITCTCTANTIVFIRDYASFGVLGLVYQPGLSKLYNNSNIFGSYLLGSYQKNSGICEIIVGPACVEIPSDGQMGSAPGTGTSSLWNFAHQIARAFMPPAQHL